MRGGPRPTLFLFVYPTERRCVDDHHPLPLEIIALKRRDNVVFNVMRGWVGFGSCQQGFIRDVENQSRQWETTGEQQQAALQDNPPWLFSCSADGDSWLSFSAYIKKIFVGWRLKNCYWLVPAPNEIQAYILSGSLKAAFNIVFGLHRPCVTVSFLKLLLVFFDSCFTRFILLFQFF